MRMQLPDALSKGPFTIDQAMAAGLSLAQLRHPRFRRIFRRVYVLAELADTREQRLAGGRLVIPPRGILCGLTAAWVHGADVRRDSDLDVHVGFAKGRRVRAQPGVTACQETLGETDVVIVDGVRVTSPTRTVFDCLRWLKGAEGIVVADALTHDGTTTLVELRTYFAGKKRLRNLRIGEALLCDVEPKAESPMETRSRVVLVRGGAGHPSVPVYVFDAWGNFLGRLDMGYELLRLGVEYDGALHWEQHVADEKRRAAMRAAGWEIIVVTAADVYGDPAGLAARVVAAQHRRARELGVTDPWAAKPR